MQMIIKPGRLVFKNVGKDDGTISIPSTLYPMPNNAPYELFRRETTEEIADTTITKVFDEAEYKIGCCFDNTKALIDKLSEHGITAVQYCGWMFLGGEYPQYHSWAVLNDGKSILDLAADWTCAEEDKYLGLPPEMLRKAIAKEQKKKLKLKNSERCGVGKINDMYTYVGAPCEAEQGKRILASFRRDFPNHPSMRPLLDTGRPIGQQILIDELEKGR